MHADTTILPTDSVSLPFSLDHVGIWFLPGILCVFVIVAIRKAMGRPHKYSVVADELGLVFSREGIGSAMAWGTLSDGRRVHLYTRSKKRNLIDMFARLLAGWWSFSRTTENIEVGVEGFASEKVADGDRPLFREYAHRALSDAYARHRPELVAAGIYRLECDRDTIRARDVRVRGAAEDFLAGVTAVIEVARQVERAALEELARVRGGPVAETVLLQGDVAMSHQEVEGHQVGSCTEQIVSESVVCRYCQARTPADTGRCQMCGKHLDAPIETNDEQRAGYAEALVERDG